MITLSKLKGIIFLLTNYKLINNEFSYIYSFATWNC
jgi:hypothetical protein